MSAVDFAFTIDFPVIGEWDNVDHVRLSVQTCLATLFRDVDRRDALVMVAGELLENAVKYAMRTAEVTVFRFKLWGTVAGGWQLARGALIAKRRLDEGSDDFDFYRGKIGTARFFAEHILPLAHAYRAGIVHGSASVLGLEETQF